MPFTRGTNREDITTRRAGAARITDWLPVWLSGSEGSYPAGPQPYNRLLNCIGFQLNKVPKRLLLAGLQALKDNFRRSRLALNLRKCGAKGSRTPDLLHAMQQEQRSGLGLYSFCLDLLCPGVPVSACKSVRVGCPLGCPLVSDHICRRIR